MNSSKPQGSFSSPIHDFGKNSFRYELNLPENIGKLVGSEELVVSVETKGNWSYFLPKNETHLYKMKMNQSAAEGFCAKQGGHLASVESQEKEKELIQLGNRPLWLGARRKSEEAWEWLDRGAWSYQNWHGNQPNKF